MNRIVLVLHIVIAAVIAAATYIGAVTNSLPTSWAPIVGFVVVVLGLIAAVTTAVLKYLDGSQKFDALQAQPAQLGLDRRAVDGSWAPASALVPESAAEAATTSAAAPSAPDEEQPGGKS